MRGLSVDVVIPCRDRPSLVLEAILSALEINEVDQVIVVDDYSQPPLEDVILPQLMANCERVIFVRNDKSPGAQRSRLLGLATSRAQFVIFLDSDDLLQPPNVSQAIEKVFRDPESVLFFGDVLSGGKVFKPGRKGGNHAERALWNLSLAPFSGLIVKRSAAKTAQFDQDIPACQDDDFVISMAEVGPIAYIPKVLAELRVHEGVSRISNNERARHQGLTRLFEKNRMKLELAFGKKALRVWRVRIFSAFLGAAAESIEEHLPSAFARPLSLVLKLAQRVIRRAVAYRFDWVYI